jgi:hypothetical protein
MIIMATIGASVNVDAGDAASGGTNATDGKILLSDSAYTYWHNRPSNPPETKYLTNDNASVVFGFCWEEPRDIGEIRLKLDAPKSNFLNCAEIEYFAPSTNWQASRQYTWGQGSWAAYPASGRMEDERTVVFPAAKVRTVKLRMRLQPPHTLEELPKVEAAVFGVTEMRPSTCTIETGLWGHKPSGADLAIYNGKIAAVDRKGSRIKVTLLIADAIPEKGTRIVPDRTVVSIPTPQGTVSFLPGSLQKQRYICIPDFGVMIYADAAVLPAGYRDAAPRKGEKILDRVRKATPQTFERVLKEVGMKPVKDLPETKAPVRKEPGSFLTTPDSQWNMQWDRGATHLLTFCRPQANGRWEIRNGPYGMLAQESLCITRILDRFKYHDICRGGHETYLDSYSVRRPEGLFQTTQGCLCMPYGVKPGDSWLGLDPGCVLIALAEHYLITRDKQWLAGRADKLLGGCDWILREIDLHKTPGAWDNGLIPPVICGDIIEFFSYYYINAIYYEGLVKATRAIGELDGEYGARANRMKGKIEEFRTAIRTAYRKSLGLAPVEPLRDGTFAPGMPTAPYLRGFLSDIYPVSPVIALRNAWVDIDLGVAKLIETGIFTESDPETAWITDVLEDRLMLDSFLLPKKWDTIGTDPITGSRDATGGTTDYDAEKDWFSWGGTGWQNGYFPLPEVYLLLGERNAFIRTMYNSYAIEADKDTGWFREVAATVSYPPKSHEEAQFLNRLLASMMYEYGDRLILCGGVPDTWYDKGFSFREMPTYFGEAGLNVERKGNSVFARFAIKRTAKTSQMRLTLRHPDGGRIKSVKVNGVESRDFDPRTSFILINPALDEWTVEAVFTEK